MGLKKLLVDLNEVVIPSTSMLLMKYCQDIKGQIKHYSNAYNFSNNTTNLPIDLEHYVRINWNNIHIRSEDEINPVIYISPDVNYLGLHGWNALYRDTIPYPSDPVQSGESSFRDEMFDILSFNDLSPESYIAYPLYPTKDEEYQKRINTLVQDEVVITTSPNLVESLFKNTICLNSAIIIITVENFKTLNSFIEEQKSLFPEKQIYLANGVLGAYQIYLSISQ